MSRTEGGFQGQAAGLEVFTRLMAILVLIEGTPEYQGPQSLLQWAHAEASSFVLCLWK